MLPANAKRAQWSRARAACVASALLLGLLGLPGLAGAAAVPLRADVQLADFKREPASEDTMRMAQWALDSGNNAALPFVFAAAARPRPTELARVRPRSLAEWLANDNRVRKSGPCCRSQVLRRASQRARRRA